MSQSSDANANRHTLQIQTRSADVDRVWAHTRSGGGGNLNAEDFAIQAENVWVHCAGVWEWDGSLNTRREAYANGSSTTENNIDRNPISLNRTSIGSVSQTDGNGFDNLTGDISHVAVWNTILTDDQILALSNGFSPLRIQRDNLINYYPMGFEGTLYDVIGGFDMTNENSPTLAASEPPITQFKRGGV
jgi:hypothetical protein